jgi:hypothetical protein
MTPRRIGSTGMDPAMAHSQYDQTNFDEDVVDYVPEKVIELADICFNSHSSFLAATEAGMQF